MFKHFESYVLPTVTLTYLAPPLGFMLHNANIAFEQIIDKNKEVKSYQFRQAIRIQHIEPNF